MTITKDIVASQLHDYLNNDLSLQELVDWAERAMMDGEFEPGGEAILRDVIARLGAADVQAFSLIWEDCRDMLGSLGYNADIHISPISRSA